jgi:hypothetical protein
MIVDGVGLAGEGEVTGRENGGHGRKTVAKREG